MWFLVSRSINRGKNNRKVRSLWRGVFCLLIVVSIIVINFYFCENKKKIAD